MSEIVLFQAIFFFFVAATIITAKWWVYRVLFHAIGKDAKNYDFSRRLQFSRKWTSFVTFSATILSLQFNDNRLPLIVEMSPKLFCNVPWEITIEKTIGIVWVSHGFSCIWAGIIHDQTYWLQWYVEICSLQWYCMQEVIACCKLKLRLDDRLI